MGEQKDEDLYRNFSRKDLQGLCKKYGLPANKSNSEMATSLILYLEKKNLSSRTVWEATRSEPLPSGISEIGARMISTAEGRKECGAMASRSGSGNNRCSDPQDAQQNSVWNYKDPAASDKTSEDVGFLTQLRRDSNSGAGFPENAFSSVVNSPVEAPSPAFKFDVSCEDGIQLYVDLNSSTSDWIESMKAGVHICHDLQKSKSQSFHEELGSLYCSKKTEGSCLIDSYKDTNNHQVEGGSYPTTMATGDQAQADETDQGEGSLSSSRLKPFSDVVHSLENLGEEQALLSSRLESDLEKQVCGAKSCIRADSDVNIVTQIRKSCNFSGNSVSSGPKCSGLSENQGLSTASDTYKKPSLQQTYDPLDSVGKCTGSSAADTMEIHASPCTALAQDTVHSPSRVLTCLDLADRPRNTGAEHCGTTNSVQFHGDVCQIQPVEIIDGSKCVSCSPCINSQPLDMTDQEHNADTELAKAAILSKSSGQITEAQTYSGSSDRKGMSLSPCEQYESLGIANVTKSIDAEHGGSVGPHESGQEAIEMQSSVAGVQRKDASLHPCNNGGSIDVVPKPNGIDSCTLTRTNELDEDISKSQPTNIAENLGGKNAGDGRESSECLNFRNLMEKSSRKPANSKSSGDLKRKKQFNCVEDQSKSVNPDARILRTSKQFAGDFPASRRRSSRLFTK